MEAYYNEFDNKKCAALKELQNDGHITKGTIDGRSIQDVRPSDIQGYRRAHFFAGIGLWDYALDLAGWPEDIPVWTGSCPCQPYSTAGRQRGKKDDRHLWPEWLRLIRECRPTVIFGEQVANAVSFGWLDDVYQGLEAEGYAVGAAVLPACSVGSPHRRDRLWFVAYLPSERWREARADSKRSPIGASSSGTLGDTLNTRPQGHTGHEQESVQERWQGTERHSWETGTWIDCADGKQRLVEPGIQLLAHGYPERVGLLHSAGDAIVPQVAAGFIESFLEVISCSKEMKGGE